MSKSSGIAPFKSCNLLSLISSQDSHLQGLPLFQRLREKLSWWRKQVPPAEVLKLISQGVAPEWDIPPPRIEAFQRPKSLKEIQEATEILEDYSQSGAVKIVPPCTSRHLVPWFVISKEEGENVKKRLISDCRAINQFFTAKPFKLDHLQTIFPYLKRGTWGAKIDLKDAYFHLPVREDLKPYLHLQVGENTWEFQAACFGLSILPQKFMLLMKVLEKIWRAKGIMCFVYLDDILLLGNTAKQVEKDLHFMVHTLLEAGFKINVKKSILEPTQNLGHLGFILNLAQGQLEVCPGKLKMVRRELGKLMTTKKLLVEKWQQF
jgi:hypothetical protein